MLLSLVSSKKVNAQDDTSRKVSFLISAYNEEKNIEDCINSILQLDYPNDNLDIIIGSDGSSDRTNHLIEKLSETNSNIKLYKFSRIGKNQVLNKLIDEANGDLIYFLDADMILESHHLRKVTAKFADSSVGGVITSIRSHSKSKENIGAAGEKFYQFFESYLRKLESSIKTSTTSLGGGCYRKELIDKIPNDTFCDDLFFVLNTAKKKSRVIYMNDLKVTEGRGKSLTKEFNRRIRVVSCGMSTIFGMKGLIGFSSGITAFFIWSHKIVRWFSIFYILIIFLFTFLLSPGEFKEWMLLFNYMIIVSIYSAYVFEITDVKFPLFKLPLFYFIMISSFTFGLFRFLSNKQNSIWTEQGLVESKNS
jgi:cellulose synthase/poly-beta-1,6-N-acetylglucosamine synthase-like glycosyltransferase